MAVVQISRIQQRRGKKNTDIGFPQLASGELGWAIDTQELYIGNGAVSEGAPYVGNTKIITEHDDILRLVTLYRYQKNVESIQTGASPLLPIDRSLQDRLDDIVSVRAFGVIGDGITDDTEALQRAIDQLYLNDSTKLNVSSRVVLNFEPGIYIVSDEIKIPPYAYLIGCGIDSTIIRQTVDKPLFRMVDANSSPGNYTEFESMNPLVRPREILISGMTLETTVANRIVYLDNTSSTLFDRIKFQGIYVNGTSPVDNQIGIEIRSASSVFCTDNTQFYFCNFSNTGYGVYSDNDHNNINFDTCVFYQLYDGLQLGGGIEGSLNTNVSNCYFDLIDRYGIWIKQGYGNSSSGNKFMNVGNNFQGYAAATYPIILFDTENNTSADDYFERNTKLKDQNLYAYLPFIPNVQTSGMIYDNTGFQKEFQETLGSAIVFLRLPVYTNGKYMIDYVLNKTTSGTALRTGTMLITVDVTHNLINFNDTFNYTGSSSVENIVFTASLADYNSDSNFDTLVINIYNPGGTGSGTMNYAYRLLTQG